MSWKKESPTVDCMSAVGQKLQLANLALDQSNSLLKETNDFKEVLFFFGYKIQETIKTVKFHYLGFARHCLTLDLQPFSVSVVCVYICLYIAQIIYTCVCI
jgi:hypothetical protein